MQLEHELYCYLFAQTANAIEAMETMDFWRARSILIHAHQECESRYIADNSSQADIEQSTTDA